MKILLINPNRNVLPPVPPIGLEYLAASLVHEGHEIKILDLTFHGHADNLIDDTISGFRPELAGVTVRNIDSVLFSDNEFYLDSVRDVVHRLKVKHGQTVVIGGAGVVVNPEAVLEYLGADCAVAGPAENVIHDLLDAFSRGTGVKKVWRGSFRPYSSCSRITTDTDYQKYYNSGGVAGFETHKGCSSSCIYCIEAQSIVAFKRPEDVIREIREFVERGFSHFHLCDAEFNEDLDHSIEFCSTLKRENMQMQWALYMKPANYNQRLFRLMKETGVNLITLTVDSFKKCPLYWHDAEKIIFNAQSNGIRIAVDFLTGFPYEETDLLTWCLDFFRRLQPDRVTINTFIRLYRPLMITKIIERDETLKAHILGSRDDKDMILPIFYNQTDQAWLRDCISGDDLFRIEGDEKGVNYTRI
ncbi:MAG: cobalamin B12-binding domain-containing protein [Nitrospirae bacterium]|nr:cobalamin B12-binding domain-containing protein [Nitrospirota bacterium]